MHEIVLFLYSSFSVNNHILYKYTAFYDRWQAAKCRKIAKKTTLSITLQRAVLIITHSDLVSAQSSLSSHLPSTET